MRAVRTTAQPEDLHFAWGAALEVLTVGLGRPEEGLEVQPVTANALTTVTAIAAGSIFASSRAGSFPDGWALIG